MYNNKIRKEDEKCADIVSKFLEKHFYNKVENYEKIDDKEQQVKGVDVIFILNGKQYVCDEKAAIRYVNKNLQTFAFELSFLGKGDKLIDGWLISNTKINNSFLCIWIDKADYDLLEDIDDIKEMEIALVDKNKLMEYLQNLGWTVSKLNVKADRMRKNPKEPQGEIETNGCRFVCSRKLAEKPVNVLVSREKLKEIADYTEKIVVN
jgi:hypothetical protein